MRATAYPGILVLSCDALTKGFTHLCLAAFGRPLSESEPFGNSRCASDPAMLLKSGGSMRLDGKAEHFGQRRHEVIPAEDDIRRCAHQVGPEGKRSEERRVGKE